MIKIKYESKERITLKDITENNWNENKSAFYGRAGDGPLDLYIVTFSSIAKLRYPHKTWTSKDCSVWVENWVDLDIVATPRT